MYNILIFKGDNYPLFFYYDQYYESNKEYYIRIIERLYDDYNFLTESRDKIIKTKYSVKIDEIELLKKVLSYVKWAIGNSFDRQIRAVQVAFDLPIEKSPIEEIKELGESLEDVFNCVKKLEYLEYVGDYQRHIIKEILSYSKKGDYNQ
jgi:hypothetical protein